MVCNEGKGSQNTS